MPGKGLGWCPYLKLVANPIAITTGQFQIFQWHLKFSKELFMTKYIIFLFQTIYYLNTNQAFAPFTLLWQPFWMQPMTGLLISWSWSIVSKAFERSREYPQSVFKIIYSIRNFIQKILNCMGSRMFTTKSILRVR